MVQELQTLALQLWEAPHTTLALQPLDALHTTPHLQPQVHIVQTLPIRQIQELTLIVTDQELLMAMSMIVRTPWEHPMVLALRPLEDRPISDLPAWDLPTLIALRHPQTQAHTARTLLTRLTQESTLTVMDQESVVTPAAPIPAFTAPPLPTH
jgi:hypothetical protein